MREVEDFLKKILNIENAMGVLMPFLASFPGPLKKSEKGAWYPLFAHALN